MSSWSHRVNYNAVQTSVDNFYLFYILAKWLSWSRTDYLPMQMTQATGSFRKPADRPAVAASLLAGTWLGFRSSAWYLIITKLKLQSLVYPGLWALPMVTWSCLEFPFALATTSTSLAWSLTVNPPSKTMWVVLFPVSLRELVFWGW